MKPITVKVMPARVSRVSSLIKEISTIQRKATKRMVDWGLRVPERTGLHSNNQIARAKKKTMSRNPTMPKAIRKLRDREEHTF